MLKIEVEGQGNQFYFSEISQQTYDFYKDENELLWSAVTDPENFDDAAWRASDSYSTCAVEPEELDIEGYYDESYDDCVLGFEIGNSSLEVYCGGDSQTIELSEENIKKLGINCKTKSVSMEDFIKDKEGFVFLAYEELGGTNNDLPELYEEEAFDPKKLSLTITNFKWSGVEVRLVTQLGYGNEQTDFNNFSGDMDVPVFELLKVFKTDLRYFEFKDAHSSKFWEISVAGSTVTARYGKIGTNGQTSVKELDSPEQAKEHARKQAAGKLKKGYQEI